MLKAVERSFLIKSMGYPYEQAFSADFAYDGESHDFVEMVFVKNGKVEVAENGKVYLLEGGNIIFHAPMEFHRIKSAEGTTPCINNLSFTVQGALPELLYDGAFELDLEEQAEFLSIFYAVQKNNSSGTYDTMMAHHAAVRMEAFIFGICARNRKSGSYSSQAGALMYERLVKGMQAGVYDGISLSELAEKNYISQSYVKTLFYRYAGISAGKYYAGLKVNEAKRLIESGTVIAEIAEKLGFSSPNYFSLFFKKQTGMTPSEYKRRHAILPLI